MKSVMTLASIIFAGVFLLPFAPGQPLAQDKDAPEEVRPPAKNYYLKTAKTHLEQKEYEKAIGALELAVLLEPDNQDAQALLKESKRLWEEGKRPPTAKSQTDGSRGSEAASQRMNNVYTAIKDERYDAAGTLLDEILTADPKNKEALYLKEKVNDKNHSRITAHLKTTHKQESLKGSEALREASIPYQDTLRFPAKEKWKDIASRELPDLDKIVEENKRTTAQLQRIPVQAAEAYPQAIEDALSMIISFEFVDTSLKDVIVFIREKTNVNMIIDSTAGSIPITLKLKDVTVKTALKYILPKGYEYVVEGDIIHVYKQKMEMRVYDVRDILINLDDKEPLKFDITAAATSQLTMAKEAKTSIKEKDASERVFDLIEQIVTTIEPASWSSNTNVIGASAVGGQRRINVTGQGEGSIIARMGQPGDLVVVNSKYVHEQIENLLASLRSSQNLQVSIEARFIRVTDKFLEDIGNDLTRFFGSKANISTGAADVKGNLSGKDVSGLDLNYSILNNSMLTGFLKAVQESKDSETLTTPRITLSNTQRGNIAVVQTRNYVQSTSVSEGVVTPVIGTIPEGTTFDVRPIVSADRKYIYLEVTPSVFKIEAMDEFTFSGLTSNTTVGGSSQGTTVIPPEQTVQLPKINVSQVSVTVCVPDKGTLMIGGLGEITKDNLTSGIPILSKIPVIKHLFSHDQKNRTKQNLIILLKPTIIIKEEHETALLGGLNNETDETNLPEN